MHQLKSRFLLALATVTFTSVITHADFADDNARNLRIDVNAVTDVTGNFVDPTECEAFSDEDNLGIWGRVVAVEVMSGHVPSLWQGPQDVLRICPNYSSLTQRQRQEFWVAFVNSMAHFESSCRPQITARGVYGRAAGLLQLFQGSEQNFSAGCRRGDSTNPERALKCGLSMLNDQVERDGVLFSNQSYWAVLRPNNHVRAAPKIMRALSTFAGCR